MILDFDSNEFPLCLKCVLCKFHPEEEIVSLYKDFPRGRVTKFLCEPCFKKTETLWIEDEWKRPL